MASPTVVIGYRPSLNQIHRLTFLPNGLLEIERQPVASPHDGSLTHYPTLLEPGDMHQRLIDDILTYPCADPGEWPM